MQRKNVRQESRHRNKPRWRRVSVERIILTAADAGICCKAHGTKGECGEIAEFYSASQSYVCSAHNRSATAIRLAKVLIKL